MDLKNSMEALEFLKELGVVAAKIGKDKKVDFSDLGVFIAAVPGLISKGKDAVDGIGDVIPEFKDLDEGEVKMLVGKVFEIIYAVKNELKA